MSIYRTFNRPPLNDVHHVAEHVKNPPQTDATAAPARPEQDWTKLRKAEPANRLLPVTIRWMSQLPPQAQASATCSAFPRIGNMLARLWSDAAGFTEYIEDLLVDKRGGRRGFALEIMGELHQLHTYHQSLSPHQRATWDKP